MAVGFLTVLSAVAFFRDTVAEWVCVVLATGLSLGTIGISLEGTATTNDSTKVLNSTIRNCTVEDCDSTTSGANYALKMAFSENILVENCNFLRSQHATNTAYGFDIILELWWETYFC